MNYCLWCSEEMIDEADWYSFINGGEIDNVCRQCANELKFISGHTCVKCFKPTTSQLCNDCLKWSQFFNNNDPLEKNISTFHYNDFIKEVIAKWKYRGDYVLIDMFSSHMIKAVNKLRKSIISEVVYVPIPLSEERLSERGFNQSLAIAERVAKNKNDIQPILQRIHGEKQSKKTRTQRIFGKNPFKLIKNTNKSVILVDDIYTTGTTLRHAATLLKQGGCPAIYSYSLIRG